MVRINDRKKRNQQGFTLIEIIAVLVILGILAVVAIPKYQDLQEQARISAAKGLVAAAQSELSMVYASYKLNSTGTDINLSNICNATTLGISNGANGGVVTCTGSTNWVNSTVTINANVNGGNNTTGYWNSPES